MIRVTFYRDHMIPDGPGGEGWYTTNPNFQYRPGFFARVRKAFSKFFRFFKQRKPLDDNFG